MMKGERDRVSQQDSDSRAIDEALQTLGNHLDCKASWASVPAPHTAVNDMLQAAMSDRHTLPRAGLLL